MNPTHADPLAGLRDIHLPEAVSFWPLAPGWWIALGLVLALAAAAHLYVCARRRSLKRAALRELAGIESSYQRDADLPKLALRLSMLLRRVALTRFSRRDVASLCGEGWSRFLLRTGAEARLTGEHASELMRAVYAEDHRLSDEAAPREWIAATRLWIRGNA